MLTYGSLFSGFGGADLGLERAGLKCAWQVEINQYARRVLEKHWPQVRRWDDVRTFPPTGDELCSTSGSDPFVGFSDTRRTDLCGAGDAARASGSADAFDRRSKSGSDRKHSEWYADVICGGPPCQPTSFAGKQLGELDERWLWPDTLRIIGAIRPRYVVLENPTAILRLHGGRAFGEILAALADFGFDAEWHDIPAWAFALPHKRNRTFIVAYSAAHRREGPICGDLADFAEKSTQSIGWPIFPSALDTRRAVVETFEQRLGEPAVFGTPNGIPAWLVKAELGGIGNAICPPIAEWIGRRLVESTEQALSREHADQFGDANKMVHPQETP